MKPEDLKEGNTYVFLMLSVPSSPVVYIGTEKGIRDGGKIFDPEQTFYVFFNLNTKFLIYAKEEELPYYVKSI